MFLKTEGQAFEAGDFLNIFLRFSGFHGSFSYKNFSYTKNVCYKLYATCLYNLANILYLDIFLRFSGFYGSFSYKNFSYTKNVCYKLYATCLYNLANILYAHREKIDM